MSLLGTSIGVVIQRVVHIDTTDHVIVRIIRLHLLWSVKRPKEITTSFIIQACGDDTKLSLTE